MTEANLSQDALDKQTTALLAEVHDYLLRLPVVPATRHLARRIEEHLQQLQRAAAAAPAPGAHRLRGAIYGASGSPVLSVSLSGLKLTLTPQSIATMDDEQRLLSALSGGVTLNLREHESPTKPAAPP